MKKILSLLLVVLLLTTYSNIQAQTKISFGARAGLSFNNLSFDPDLQAGVTKSSRTGFKFGALAEIGFVPMLAIQIEPMFVTGAGAQASSAVGQETIKLSFIEIPILLKFKIPISGPVSPYVFAGPNFVIISSANDLTEPKGQTSIETDLKDYTSSFNFALDFGAGAGFKVAPLTVIMLDIRYSLGLSNAFNDKGKQSFGFTYVKTTAFQIVAGVLFGL